MIQRYLLPAAAIAACALMAGNAFAATAQAATPTVNPPAKTSAKAPAKAHHAAHAKVAKRAPAKG
jgi:hypothetical protein